MIAKLKGTVEALGENWAIIDVHGVGYQVYCSTRTLANLPAEGEAIVLYTEQVVRQDMIQLYGFKEQLEKDWFNLLTTVQGVGMKVGLAILSVLSPQEIAHALSLQDKAMISRAEGVGPKLAARIVNELKDKQPKNSYLSAEVISITSASPRLPNEEAVSALVNLGYRRQDAIDAVAQVCQNNQDPTVEEIIRQGLSRLARA